MGWFSKPKTPDYGALAEANKEAARLQYKAAKESIAEWRAQYNQTRKDLKPWRLAGQFAIREIHAGLQDGRWEMEDWDGFSKEDMEMDPGYIFRFRQGQKAIRRAANAAGLDKGGATLKALQRFGQDMGSQEFAAARARAIQDRMIQQGDLDRQFAQLSSAAGQGYAGVGLGVQAGNQQIAGINQANMAGAAARGAGAIGAANANIAGVMAQNAASQQRFNNVMTMGGLVVGGMGALSGGNNLVSNWWGRRQEQPPYT